VNLLAPGEPSAARDCRCREGAVRRGGRGRRPAPERGRPSRVHRKRPVFFLIRRLRADRARCPRLRRRDHPARRPRRRPRRPRPPPTRPTGRRVQRARARHQWLAPIKTGNRDSAMTRPIARSDSSALEAIAQPMAEPITPLPGIGPGREPRVHRRRVAAGPTGADPDPTASRDGRAVCGGTADL
jgi:hypothetical protein